MVGKTVSHYRILEKLGGGGMGVVYKAEDTKLKRTVALKFLVGAQGLAPLHDVVALERFKREARAASALNHPNIITIYDIDEAEGVHYIAMEYVAGKTLDRLIARHGLRVSQALKYAVQMAAALTKAHSAGIVHRDLKPTNVMVTDDGLVKVLDFGLAKLTEPVGAVREPPLQEMATAETAATRGPVTEEGTIVGTVGYMSPEQAEGKPVDARSDIFSFGSVLYEMLAGQRAFQGETKASTIAAILREEPKPLSQAVRGLPGEVERLVKRCLRKDREHRFQTMADLKVALEELKEESDSGELAEAPAAGAGLVSPQVGRVLPYKWAALAAVLVVAIGLAVAGWFWFRRSRPATPEAALTTVPLTTYFGSQLYPTFSPDGSQVAFSWNGEKEENSHIYVKLIGSEPPLRLTTNPANEYSPAWSPDGRWIAFCRDLPGGKYAVVLTSPIPSPERMLTESYGDRSQAPFGPFLAWSPDSHWLAMADAERPMEFLTLSLFSLETGEKRRITSPPAGVWWGDSCPAFSPDGRRLAFSRWTAWAISDLYLVDLSPDLKPLAELKRLTSGNWGAASPAWTADGKSLIFSNLSGGESSLWRVDASGSSKPERLATLGGPAAYPAISHHGNRLAYAQETMHECIWRIEIPTPGGKAKRPEKFISSTRNDDFPEFSPDGRRIAFGSDRSGSWEIWICDADGSNPVQLTSLGGQNFVIPRWSPDSRRLAFYAKIEGRSEVYVINASGGSPQRLTFGPIGSEAPSWSRDGHWILFNSSTQPPDIYKMPAEGGPAVLVRHTPAPGWWAPRESPDGKFIYFNQDTAGGLSNVVRVPIGGGEEQLVLNSPYCFLYALVEDGIYFIPKPDPKSGYSIQFLNTTTGKIQRVASLENPPWAPTVSPDRRWILSGQWEPSHGNLMLVENFR